LPARLITQADLAMLTEKVRRRVVRWFRMQRLLEADATADMVARENSGFSEDASVRITLVRLQLRGYCQPLENLLRSCARPPFALERLSVMRGEDGRIACVRYVLPRHKAANWVGPGRGQKTTRPGANGVVELSPFDFLDRLADLVLRPRKHRHRYHGVFAPNHKLRPAVTALAIGNVGKRRDAATDGHAVGGHAAGGDATADCCDSCDKPPSHDTARIAWAKLMARVGEEFPFACPGCGGDIRLRGDGRQEPAHFANRRFASGRRPGWLRPREVIPWRISANRSNHRPSRRPVARRPTGESSCRSTFDRAIFQGRIDELPDIDIHSL
jgi:hypothetical protein